MRGEYDFSQSRKNPYASRLKRQITISGAQEDAVKKVKQVAKVPKFKSEDEEAAWWASADGRDFLKHQSSGGTLQK